MSTSMGRKARSIQQVEEEVAAVAEDEVVAQVEDDRERPPARRPRAAESGGRCGRGLRRTWAHRAVLRRHPTVLPRLPAGTATITARYTSRHGREQGALRHRRHPGEQAGAVAEPQSRSGPTWCRSTSRSSPASARARASPTSRSSRSAISRGTGSWSCARSSCTSTATGTGPISHEAAANQILDDLVSLLDPRWMRVTADFTVRGNIKTVVTVEHGCRERA